MTRSGLKRVACPHGCPSLGGRPFAAYMTLPQLEHGMRPVCPGCGNGCIPEDPELWHLVPRDELERSAAWREYVRQCRSIQHGQAAHVQRGRAVRSDLEISGERVAQAVREEARARQLAGLRQYVHAAEQAAEIPF